MAPHHATRIPMCSRVLKGRYYHDTAFLQATRKRHASSTWRAILAGRVQHGLIRRVVNEDDTATWGDRWISDHFDARPITPRVEGHPNRVSELLTDSGAWNVQTVRGLFLPIDAAAIFRQPLGRGDTDFWAWQPERFGTYTVRSAYKLISKRRWDASHGHQPSSSDDGLWKKVWKLNVPPPLPPQKSKLSGGGYYTNFYRRGKFSSGGISNQWPTVRFVGSLKNRSNACSWTARWQGNSGHKPNWQPVLRYLVCMMRLGLPT